MNNQSLLYTASMIAERQTATKNNRIKRGEGFNVFQLCKVDHYENLHSAILAEFLNPLGAHGQDDTFLKLFLQSTVDDFSEQFATSKASVFTEYSTSDGRLDILITDDRGKAIIIENKIYASDQDAQLKRYEKFAKEKYHQNGYRLLYLTLYGTDASDRSGEGVEYQCISYQVTILKWLEECIKEVYNKPFLRESLIQYENHIKQITGQDMEKNIENDLINAMIHAPEGVAAIIKARDKWEKAILDKFIFEPLRLFSKEQGLRFSINDRFWSRSSWGRFAFEIEPNLLIAFEYEKQDRKSFYYGIIDTRSNRPEKIQLSGLEKGNDNWRYGWHYFEMNPNWDLDTIVEFTHDNGPILKYICDAVNKMIEEMKNANIY